MVCLEAREAEALILFLSSIIPRMQVRLLISKGLSSLEVRCCSISKLLRLNWQIIADLQMMLTVYREAGLSALAGTSDFRTITTRAFGTEDAKEPASSKDQHAARLTYDLFLDRIINYVSAYVVKILGAPNGKSDGHSGADSLSGLDGIVFSGGIGEKSVELRRDVGAYFKWLGVEVDESANKAAGKSDDPKQVVFPISAKSSKIKLFMCLTVCSLILLRRLLERAHRTFD